MRRIARIEVGTQSMRVYDYNDEFFYHVRRFLSRELSKHELVPVERSTKMEKKITAVFASKTKDNREFRITVNVKKEFLDFLRYAGYNTSRIEIIDLPTSPGVDVQFSWKSPWGEPQEHQVPWINYQDAPGVIKINTLQTGKGKAQPLDAKIKIPGGWTTMGQVKVGDKVISQDGSPTTVTAIYPQGAKEIFRITFADGRSTECCAEHLWKVYHHTTSPARRWQVINTKEIINHFETVATPRMSVPLAEPEITPEVYTRIPHYIMGVLLGDGHIGKEVLKLSTPDEYIVDRVREALPPSMELAFAKGCDYNLVRKKNAGKNEWLEDFRSFNLDQKLSDEKFIPEIYLKGSIEQRKELLRGLLDTDGTVQKTGSVSFTTTSFIMAGQVCDLVRGLGGMAAIRKRYPKYTHNGEVREGKPAYDVDIRYKKPSELFTLPRKKERTNDNNQYAAGLKLRIVSIEPVGVKEAQCISVDHPDHLYVTDDYIVTHNTFCALKTMVNMSKRTVITLSPKYLQTWLNAFDKFFEFDVEDVAIVQGTEGVIKTLDLLEQGKINPKIIVLSLQTLQFFMKAYEHMEELPYNVDDMWRIFDCGLRIQDEGHEAIHAIYKTLMYGNVTKTLVLSATLEGDSQFINRIYELVYPLKDRFGVTGYDKYIESIAYLFSMDCQANQVKWKGRMGYSHIKLEQSILKRKQTLERYMGLVDSALKDYFLKIREPGMKCLIFCATVEMCLVLTMYLKNRYPQLSIDKYTSVDPPENYMEPDIVCSTPKSCGTGVDIPGLRSTLSTVAVGSRQLNNQMLGRLRKMSGPWANITPTFVYFVCEDIKPHVQYHRKRMEIFENKTISMKTVRSGVSF